MFNSGNNGGIPTMGEALGMSASNPSNEQTQVINLAKGQRISLTKIAPSMKNVLVGLGWNTQRYSGSYDFDLDASAFLADANGITLASNVVFYGSLNETPDGLKCDSAMSVIYSGDNKVGGDGNNDDEQILINFDKVPSNIQKIAISCSIYNAQVRRQNFGMVENAFIHLVDNDTGKEIARYNMNEDFSTETAVVVAEFYRHNGEWKFKPVGSGYANGLADICKQYGLQPEGEG